MSTAPTSRFPFLFEIAKKIRAAILPALQAGDLKRATKTAHSGDTTFRIDSVAEQALDKAVGKNLAYFSEDRGLVMRRTAPEWLLIVDPIDGTRPLMCGFAMGVISIALCRFSHKATFDDIIAGVILEINSGDWFYAEKGQGVQIQTSQGRKVQPSSTEDLSTMFWSYDTVGRPARLVSHYLAELIDSSGLQAGVFVVNNAAYCLTRIVTGHLDAHVEVGARILKDHPETEADFVRIGGGRIMGTFPYDIAASYLILQEANCVITDAYGHALKNAQLLQQGKDAILSFVAASNASLHKKIINILPALN